MRKSILAIISILVWGTNSFAQTPAKRNTHYPTNQAPLVAQPYTALPLGTIKPKGMLLKMLELQRNGLTGRLDETYAKLKNDNGWLGGKGDAWEETPYWLDGALPLAYLLGDKILENKVQKYIDWTLDNQRPSGYFGGITKKERETGKQVAIGEQGDDWWPKMVMLKVMQQYYSATADQRVIKFMLRYFEYQKATLPIMERWGFWAEQRAGDNLAVVYWLYNITREKFLLDLAELIQKNVFNWTEIYSGNAIRRLSPLPSGLHCVNVAQGLKAPLIYYQQHPESNYLEAVKKGLTALQECHGFVNGMYGGDEDLHGNDPTQGSELCSAVEMMFSFESILPITGDVYYADYLEKIAYNVLPTQSTDDYMHRQYFQQANQVQVSHGGHNFFSVYDGAELVFGTKTGYTCCLANMHQGWPKFVQNLWYATADNGIAALVYGSSEITAKVANGENVTFTEQTDYPFKETIRFTFQARNKVKFPFHLRIPLWCKNPIITVNGTAFKAIIQGNIIVVNREWTSGDVVELNLPMDFRYSRWAENSFGIERGPLVYALRMEEEWHEVKKTRIEDPFLEVYPKSPWNYAILNSEMENNTMIASVKDQIEDNPWNLENAPIMVKTKGIRLPIWQLDRGSAGKIPSNSKARETEGDVTEITLIPYGCSTLRISQFPVK